ncbi:MAG: hypothetical protein AAGD01_16955 [Acidobacteriota bacterium]
MNQLSLEGWFREGVARGEIGAAAYHRRSSLYFLAIAAGAPAGKLREKLS